MLSSRERLKKIREYRGLSQETCASWFDISQQAWGKKERGETDGFAPEDIKLFLEKTQIDARYLFCQTDSIEEADLKLKKPQQNYNDLINKINEIEKKIIPAQESDQLAHLVTINKPLRDIVDMIKNIEGGKLKEVASLIWGYLYRDEKDLEREKPTPSERTKSQGTISVNPRIIDIGAGLINRFEIPDPVRRCEPLQPNDLYYLLYCCILNPNVREMPWYNSGMDDPGKKKRSNIVKFRKEI